MNFRVREIDLDFKLRTVYNTRTTTKATLYFDDRITTTTNPVTSNSDGGFYFYVTDGRYDLVISGLGINTKTLTDIMIIDDLNYTKNYPFEIRDTDPDTTGWGANEKGRTCVIRDSGDGTRQTHQ